MRILFSMLLLSLAAAHAATYDRIALKVENCQAVAASFIATLPEEWHDVASYVQRCPVHAPDGKIALTVLVVRLDIAMFRDNLFATERSLSIPDPIILDVQDRTIGTIGDGFPIDPPDKPEITFTDWQAGFPQRVDLYQAGESAVAPHPMPSLFWDDHRHRYLEGPELTWDERHHRYMERSPLVWDKRRQEYVQGPTLIWNERRRRFLQDPAWWAAHPAQ